MFILLNFDPNLRQQGKCDAFFRREKVAKVKKQVCHIITNKEEHNNKDGWEKRKLKEIYCRENWEIKAEFFMAKKKKIYH